jgi:hypothetical protein
MTRPARISDALRELVLEQKLDVDTVMDKYFVPGFRHYHNGTEHSRAQFAGLATGARREIARGTVTVLDELRDGDRYAERHTLDLVRADGSGEQAEVYIIGGCGPDGRFSYLHESGFPLASPARGDGQ